jgi:benzoylformate decarboxylase
MSYTGADLFVDALAQYDVTHVFGNPGTTELPVTRALGGADIDYVLGLHEDIAVGMAAGYAATRRYRDDRPVGVANLHVAPGLAHGLGNTYGATFSGAPVVVTAGIQSTDYRQEEPILSGDLVSMAEDVTKWSAEVRGIDALPGMVRRAFRTALTPPTGPVFLGLPLDVMTAETDAEPERLGPIPSLGDGDAAQVERAADLLAEGDDAALILGDAVARSGTDAIDAAVRLAEATGARVHGEMIAGEVTFPSDHEQWMGPTPLPIEGARKVVDADVVALIGCSAFTPDLGYEGSLFPEGTARIQIGDAGEVGKNHPADAAVLGDPGAVMDRLADRLEGRIGDALRRRRLEAAAAFGREHAPPEPALPDGRGRASKAGLVDAMAAAAPDAFLVNEAVTTARPVVGVIGDGSFLYYPHAIYTAARYDIDCTVVVPDNRNYNILKANARRIFGDDEDPNDYPAMDIDPAVDLPANAESQGVPGRLVEDADEVAPAVREAVDGDGPRLLDVLVHDE